MKEQQDTVVRQDSEGSLPFFARFLEGQPGAGTNYRATLKYPSDFDEDVTQKYPSDNDEGEVD